MYDLIVIGGGPAGLTAAVYAARKRLNVLLLTKDLGGKTRYRLALPWALEYEDSQIDRGLEIVCELQTELETLDLARHLELVDEVAKRDRSFVATLVSGDKLEARAVIIATGARQACLGVPGEKRFTMKGLCYSACSYAPLFAGRTAIVIGDDELALRSAAELAPFAKKVYWICNDRRMIETPLGRRVQEIGTVSLVHHVEILEVKGGEFARALCVRDEQGKTFEYSADGIFVEKELIPNSHLVQPLVKLDGRGRIIVDRGNRTSMPGVFAAGDVTTDFAEQVLIAASAGAKAALNAYDYLLSI